MTEIVEGVGEKALSEFLSEAQEIVENFNRDVLLLDDLIKRGKTNPDTVNNIFRLAHSLKGVSGMFGLKRISDAAHNLENLLDALRMGRVKQSASVVDVLFESIEVFNQLIAEAGGGPKLAKKPLQTWMKSVESLLKSNPESVEENPLDTIDINPAILGVLTEYEEYRLLENIRKGVNLFRVHASFALMSFDESLARLNTELKAMGEVVTTLPSPESSTESGIDFDLIVGSERSLDEIQERVGSTEVQTFEIKRRLRVAAPTKPDTSTQAGTSAAAPVPVPVSVETKASTAKPAEVPKPSETTRASTPVPAVVAEVAEDGAEGSGGAAGGGEGETPSSSGDGSSLRSVSQTVRVDIRKLDSLMNIVGELVLVRTAIHSISERLKTELGFRGLAIDLFKEMRNFERKLDELQAGIMEVRMVPLGQNFEKLSRMVRKLSRSSGKEIQLLIRGADTELDKLIVEDLADPLMHILRNSIDHGIETPEKRSQQHKPEVGQINIHAYQKGNHVVIEIADDGKGIDLAEIREVALERGIVTDEQVRDMSSRDLLNLVFLPGFSTSREVSEISGRGVGLDVVKTNIGNLSGMIDLDSTPGKGTRFVITLPITLAIIRALVIRAQDQLFAVPLNSVLEIINVEASKIRTIERREVIELRGNTLPLVRLAKLFDFTSNTQPVLREDGSEFSSLFVVVVGLAQNRLGIVVDGLIGQQDIVIKSLGKLLTGIPGIAGATNLATQQTILVMDVGSLIEETLSRE